MHPSAAIIYFLLDAVPLFSFSICCFTILTYQLRKLFNCHDIIEFLLAKKLTFALHFVSRTGKPLDFFSYSVLQPKPVSQIISTADDVSVESTGVPRHAASFITIGAASEIDGISKISALAIYP